MQNPDGMAERVLNVYFSVILYTKVGYNSTSLIDLCISFGMCIASHYCLSIMAATIKILYDLALLRYPDC